MTARSFVIAIDGPGASGKGTLARRLAEHFGFAHLDTGALYRATAFLVLEQAGDPADPVTAARAAGLVFPGLLSDPRLRGEAVSAAASIVAAIPEVRQVLVGKASQFGGGRQRTIHRTRAIDLGQRDRGDHLGTDARAADRRRGDQPLRCT